MSTERTGREPTTAVRAALRPRMIGLLVLLLAAAAVCGRLGVWQLDRAQERGAQNERTAQAQRLAAPPVPLAEVLAPQTSFTADMVGRRVEAVGTFDTDGQLVVTNRARDGETGYLVLTPLRVAVDDPSQGTPVIPVVRGWVASLDAAAQVPAAPTGTVHVTGYLQASEAAGTLDAAARTADAISSAQLVNTWGGPIYSGYLVVASTDPPQSDQLLLLSPPTVRGAGLNLQNLAYAAQWWIFGGFAVLLWIRMVRDEAAGDGPGGQDGSPDVTAPTGGDATP